MRSVGGRGCGEGERSNQQEASTCDGATSRSYFSMELTNRVFHYCLLMEGHAKSERCQLRISHGGRECLVICQIQVGRLCMLCLSISSSGSLVMTREGVNRRIFCPSPYSEHMVKSKLRGRFPQNRIGIFHQKHLMGRVCPHTPHRIMALGSSDDETNCSFPA